LEAAAAELGVERIEGGATRRNITVELPSLPRTHGTRIEIAEAVLAVWRDCTPCDVMEASVAPGARAALRNRAGVSATVVVVGSSESAIRFGWITLAERPS
ncbi:MAG: sulfurase, partial [Acidimicrobiia bacterium]|nr:sulfurase [Acidimicrobiia bacterium]